MNHPKIALVHAAPLAIAPINQAFVHLWSDARCVNLVDDSLPKDLAAAGHLTPDLTQRFVTLAQYAKAIGSHGILFTCSAFGPAIDEAKRIVGLPTLKPNEAMYDEALQFCQSITTHQPSIGLVTTFEPAAKSMLEELQQAIAQRSLNIKIASACAAGAMDIFNQGDATMHDSMIVEAVKNMPPCDVYVLGQFSMARAIDLVAAVSKDRPVLTSPDSAVRRMKAELGAA